MVNPFDLVSKKDLKMALKYLTFQKQDKISKKLQTEIKKYLKKKEKQ